MMPAPQSTAELLDAALAHGRAKIPVFRCAFPTGLITGVPGCCCYRSERCDSPGKHPVEKRGFHKATTDPEAIESWWATTVWNIGIRTGDLSGLVVLDVDPRHGGDRSLSELEGQHGPLPTTWRSLTGGNGQHILFAHPGGYIKSIAGAFGPGLDIKADGGFIVAPPSLHISGRRYAISPDHHPENVELAPLPDWLMAGLNIKLRRKSSANSSVDWQAFANDPIVKGERNSALARLAGLLWRQLTQYPDLVLELVLAWNAKFCRPPFDEREVERIVSSIGQYDTGSAAGNGTLVP